MKKLILILSLMISRAFAQDPELIMLYDITPPMDWPTHEQMAKNAEIMWSNYYTLTDRLNYWLDKEDFYKAIPVCKEIMRIPLLPFREYNMAQYWLASCYSLIGDKGNTLKYINYYTKSRDGYLDKGGLYFNINEYKMAEKYWMKALKTDPYYKQTYENLIDLYKHFLPNSRKLDKINMKMAKNAFSIDGKF